MSRQPFWLARTAAGGLRISPESCGTELVAGGAPVRGPLPIAAREIDRGLVLEVGKRVVLLLHRWGDTKRCDRRLGFVGDSEPMEQLRRLLLRMAPRATPVLLQGESGTGKELAAQALHDASPRRDRPYLCVNLAAIPTATAAAELFGHVAGAFTGATEDRPGYFQRADGGSLFLDEVGATTPEIQAMLLRVLESGEIQPVGAAGTRTVDVRVLAATDEDLLGGAASGAVRAPLYHRLSASRVELPPLRHRKDDIARLLVHFLSLEMEAAGLSDRLQPSDDHGTPWFPAPLVARLLEHPWPGNVRQLQNAIRNLVIVYGEDDRVDTDAVMTQLDESAPPSQPSRRKVPRTPDERASRTDQPSSARPAEITEQALVSAMRANRYNIHATARQLGISRGSLYTLIERSPGLRKARDLSREELAQCMAAHGDDWDAMADELGVSVKALKLRKKELALD